MILTNNYWVQTSQTCKNNKLKFSFYSQVMSKTPMQVKNLTETSNFRALSHFMFISFNFYPFLTPKRGKWKGGEEKKQLNHTGTQSTKWMWNCYFFVAHNVKIDFFKKKFICLLHINIQTLNISFFFFLNDLFEIFPLPFEGPLYHIWAKILLFFGLYMAFNLSIVFFFKNFKFLLVLAFINSHLTLKVILGL